MISSARVAVTKAAAMWRRAMIDGCAAVEERTLSAV